MFSKYRLHVSEITKLQSLLSKEYWLFVNPLTEKEFEEERKGIRKSLLPLVIGAIGKNGVIDGKILADYTFPVGEDGKYDVFISHSHNDRDNAFFSGIMATKVL